MVAGFEKYAMVRVMVRVKTRAMGNGTRRLPVLVIVHAGCLL
jgi:hypothetical protein